MAKKNTKTAGKKPASNKTKAPAKATSAKSPAATDEVVIEETPSELEIIAVETVTEANESPLFDPNSDEPIEIFFELGEEEKEELSPTTESTVEITPESPAEVVPDEPATDFTETTKTKKSRLTGDTVKLVGCSYHFFRKFFKKRFNTATIKVRFVKAATGYNGYIEVADADKAAALALLEQIKTDNSTVKNLWWAISE